MSDEVITSVDQVTTGWLTSVLTRSGVLDKGTVEAVDVISEQLPLSTNARLKVKYTSGSRGNMPQKLFLKMVNTDTRDGFFGASEINYYFRDYVGLEGVPLVPSYDAKYSETQRRYSLLMDDVSDTHIPAISKSLTLEHGCALAEGLATIHAHWWGRKRLEEGNEPLPSAETIQRYVSIAQPGAEHIIASCADQLKAHWPDTILKFYEKHPRLMIERTQGGNGFTLVHGDLNGFNVLVPIEGYRPIYLIDRQPFDWSLTTWLGVSDFIFTLVIDCEVEIRRRLEKLVLKHYHDHLIKNGVRGYSWEHLWNDYRLSAAMCIYVVTEWSRETLNVEALPIWMPMLHRSMTAVDDLECANLWS